MTVAEEGLVAAANALVAGAAGRDPWLADLPVAGIGWATVELERAAADLAAAFIRAGLPEPRWSPGARDELLGASAWVRGARRPAAGFDAAPAVVLLEPDTEGRLAATLARFGEGVGAVYVAGPAGRAIVDAARLGRRSSGPLGPARLLLARPAWGPSILVLDR